MRNVRRRCDVTFQETPNGPGRSSNECASDFDELHQFYHEVPLKSYSAIVQLLLQRYTNDDNIAKLDAKVRNLKQGSVTAAESARDCGQGH